MILKGSQRGNGQNLAAHLMRLDENDHVRLHELRGFAASDLSGAFKEAEAVSLGTKCRQYLFSLSINPPSDKVVSEHDFDRAIDRIEERLLLQGQPRAIVFHEKNARLHAHCVWSRIDAETMTARQMSFFKNRLTELSRDIHLEFGWQMPRGLLATAGRDPTNFTLAEWQQAKRRGQDPRWIKQIIGDCWARSDNKSTFERGLGEHALVLSRGDRRGFVVVDHEGEVHSLSRCLGLKAKDLSARLGNPAELGSVKDAKQSIAKRLVPAMQRHIVEAHVSFQKNKARLDLARADLVQRQRAEREEVKARQQLELEGETRTRAARLPTGLRGLWHRITGKYQEVRRQNEREAEASKQRQADERQKIVEQQREQRQVLQKQIAEVRKAQSERLRELRREVGRFLTFASSRERHVEAKQTLSSPLKLQR